MQDQPYPRELLEVVAKMLREVVLPQVSGRTVFDLRVAINAVDLVARQLAHSEKSDTDELARLSRLLGRSGNLDELNQALSQAIESGKQTLENPALREHLWATTLEKLQIDQPNYSAYVAELKS